jgi:hypothetical protein
MMLFVACEMPYVLFVDATRAHDLGGESERLP